jgi:hypothetical protein
VTELVFDPHTVVAMLMDLFALFVVLVVIAGDAERRQKGGR